MGCRSSYNEYVVDWSSCTLVESNADRVHGACVLRGTRLLVAIVFECLANGATINEIVDWYGGITAEQIRQLIAYVAEQPQAPVHAGTF